MPRANNDDYDSDMSDDGSSVKKRTSRRNKKDDSEDESIEEVEKKRVRKGKRGKQNDDNDEEKDGEDDGLLGGEKDKGGRKGSGLFSGWGKKRSSENADPNSGAGDSDDSDSENSDSDDGGSKSGKKKGKKSKKDVPLLKKKKKEKGKHKAHKSSAKTNLSIIKEGLKSFIPLEKDIKGKPIHVSEASAFVKAAFGDGTGPSTMVEMNDILRDVEEEKTKGKFSRSVYVYVESASTGRFFRYAVDPSSSTSEVSSFEDPSQTTTGRGEHDFEKSREAAMQRLERLMHTGFLILQGLLAGYSGETVYEAFASTTKEAFLEEYSTLANETRRFYYILTTISFVGALNNWRSVVDSNEAWRSRNFVEKAELLLLVLIYVAGLCFTLITGVYDMDFYYHNGIKDSALAADTKWFMVALQDEEFEYTVTIWRALCVGRFCCVIIGWLVVCRILHRSSGRAAEAVRESENLNQSLDNAKKRIGQLTGGKLDKMTREDLLNLAQIQRNALEQTEHVLENMPRDPADAFALGTTTSRTGGFGGTWTGGRLNSTGGGLMGSPTRTRTQSALPASISSKAPPMIKVDEENDEADMV